MGFSRHPRSTSVPNLFSLCRLRHAAYAHPRSRPTSSVAAANTSSDGAPPATSVAKRRRAACSSASPRDSSVLNGTPDHLANRAAQSHPADTATRHNAPRDPRTPETTATPMTQITSRTISPSRPRSTTQGADVRRMSADSTHAHIECQAYPPPRHDVNPRSPGSRRSGGRECRVPAPEPGLTASALSSIAERGGGVSGVVSLSGFRRRPNYEDSILGEGSSVSWQDDRSIRRS